MGIDSRGWERKKKTLQKLPAVLKSLIQDGAQFMQSKIVTEILNGPAGQNHPKTGYASSISRGQTGFIGVVSGNLRRSIQDRKGQGEYQRIVFVNESGAVADYAQQAANFVFQKYGADFMEIAVELYGEFMFKTMRKELLRFFAFANARKAYTYKNPFPA